MIPTLRARLASSHLPPLNWCSRSGELIVSRSTDNYSWRTTAWRLASLRFMPRCKHGRREASATLSGSIKSRRMFSRVPRKQGMYSLSRRHLPTFGSMKGQGRIVSPPSRRFPRPREQFATLLASGVSIAIVIASVYEPSYETSRYCFREGQPDGTTATCLAT